MCRFFFRQRAAAGTFKLNLQLTDVHHEYDKIGLQAMTSADSGAIVCFQGGGGVAEAGKTSFKLDGK